MTITPETDVRPPDEESELRTTPPATSDGSGRRSIITTIATGAARRWRVTLAFLLVIIGTGAWAYGFGLNREGFPPVNTPFSVVSGTWFVDDAEQTVKVKVAESQVLFATAPAVLASNLDEGNFPPYQDVVPKDGDKKAQKGAAGGCDGHGRAPVRASMEQRCACAHALKSPLAGA